MCVGFTFLNIGIKAGPIEKVIFFQGIKGDKGIGQGCTWGKGATGRRNDNRKKWAHAWHFQGTARRGCSVRL